MLRYLMYVFKIQIIFQKQVLIFSANVFAENIPTQIKYQRALTGNYKVVNSLFIHTQDHLFQSLK